VFCTSLNRPLLRAVMASVVFTLSTVCRVNAKVPGHHYTYYVRVFLVKSLISYVIFRQLVKPYSYLS
jgi:hypothetical protein